MEFQPYIPAFPPLAPRTLGYEMRNPSWNENYFFSRNPSVAGMATEDNRVIFNPSWERKATPQQKQGLYALESARLYMKKDDSWKDVKLTPEQERFFRMMNDPYYSKLGDLTKQTIVSRIIAGDVIPDAPYTDEQVMIANKVRSNMENKSK